MCLLSSGRLQVQGPEVREAGCAGGFGAAQGRPPALLFVWCSRHGGTALESTALHHCLQGPAAMSGYPPPSSQQYPPPADYPPPVRLGAALLDCCTALRAVAPVCVDRRRVSIFPPAGLPHRDGCAGR